MNCPRDHHPLELQTFWKYPRQVCRSCGGVLLGRDDVMDALGMSRPKAGEALQRLQFNNLPKGRISCPSDDTPMRLIYREGVELDICPTCHSVWVDRGERERIAAIRKQSRGDVDPDLLDGDTDGDTGLDLNLDGVLDFVGDAVGSLFNALGP